MGADPSNLVSDSFSMDIEANESTSSSFVKLERFSILHIITRRLIIQDVASHTCTPFCGSWLLVPAVWSKGSVFNAQADDEIYFKIAIILYLICIIKLLV